MVHPPAGPSSKALGKRPMRSAAAASSPLSVLTSSANSPVPDDETDDGSLAPSTGSMQTRLNRKRILPSRVRRGGVGSLVGTNEIDVTILDMLTRKGENDPLIPTRTVFVLTTDSSQVPSASTSEIGLNQLANERYFERPEVIKAYKRQQNIQVPEFIQMDEEMVGGRLRARSGEVESYELSDAAYEKRHRKHEMMEKRQRLREKEKLQHEHYKLKERIDQLRIMDYNAFLGLPDDVFGNVESAMVLGLPDGAEAGIGSTASLHEAERRRKLMLDVATSLEERYRTLLPPERRPAELRFVTRPGSASVEPSIPDEDTDEISVGPDRDGSASIISSSRSKLPKLKLKVQATAQPTPPPTAATELSSRRRRGVSVVDETLIAPPEIEPLEDSITVAASHSISSRQTRSRASERLESTHYVLPQTGWDGKNLADAFPDPFAFSNHTHHISTTNPNQYISEDHLESNGVPPTSNDGRVAPIPRVQEASSFTGPTSRRRRRATVIQNHTDPHFTVIHYMSPREQEPSRKKTKSFHAAADDMLPSSDQDVDEVSEDRDRMTDIQSTTHATTAPSQIGHIVQEMQSVASTILQPEETPSEPITLLEPYSNRATASEDSSLSPSEERSVPFAQLRQLEQPDQAGDFDIPEQPELYETLPADEPITPPWEPKSSLITEAHQTFLVPTTLEPVNKSRRRRSTPFPRREPSASLPPDLPSSTFLPIVSVESYDIPASDGTRKKLKTLGCLLAASRYNEERGRKTGRTVKAFGIEAPSFEGKDESFELPLWMIREVLAGRRLENDSDGESDGDPPSFATGMTHGEAQHGSFPDSSATGYIGVDRQ